MNILKGLCLFLTVLWTWTSCYGAGEDSLMCKECIPQNCPVLTFCWGQVIKDECNCCSRCSSDLFQPHARPKPKPAVQKKEDACDKVKCPKYKVCLKNIQGLPLCTCPSDYICSKYSSKKAPEKAVCGSDGNTYASRCHLRIASCRLGKRIKRKHKGACTPDDLIVRDKPSEQNKTKQERIEEIVQEANRKDKKRRQRKKRQRRQESFAGNIHLKDINENKIRRKYFKGQNAG
ncbi:hypothetical protein CHS0354_029971 [Potamilus streckersoni]|uniref:Kazal-like domain-containing protein n=1 Tax=Potamilus streckersoni TaxID=2493646 RepID=A0AAE0TJ56_9BIVA|nr:hypothetical protein CHS0354_029971 [Potamilus streckersoni]